MQIKKITITGAGTLGSQIAWQAAFHGFEVSVYDPFEKGIAAAKDFHRQFAELFKATLGASDAQIEQTVARLSYSTDLAEAVRDADLISESVPEDVEIKKSFYRDLAKVAPEKTIFTTNSSTLLPSQFAEETGRPGKFLALHFANEIWKRNIGEIMGHPGTEPEIFKQVVEFTKLIGMVPIPLFKEQNGYIVNSLLIPMLSAACDLLVNEVSDYQSIDKTWMIGVGAIGPCALLDVIGLETAYNIWSHWGQALNDPAALARADYIKKNFVDQGNLGVKTGQGFYSYPNPAFADPGFLKLRIASS